MTGRRGDGEAGRLRRVETWRRGVTAAGFNPPVSLSPHPPLPERGGAPWR